MHVSKIIVLKGKTIQLRAKDHDKWEKVELTVEIVLTENDDPELAKEQADMYLESWLKKEEKR